MTDYIKRENAIKAVHEEWDECINYDGSGRQIAFDTEDALCRLDAEDVALVRHGHWIIKCVREYELSYGGTAYVPEYECSLCGFTTESYVRLDDPIMPEDADFPKYCEYCGAKMDGGDTDA